MDKRSTTVWLKTKLVQPEKGDKTKSEKTIIDNKEQLESRATVDTIRSMGVQRVGITTTTAGAVDSKEVIKVVFDLKESVTVLAKYVTE